MLEAPGFRSIIQGHPRLLRGVVWVTWDPVLKEKWGREGRRKERSREEAERSKRDGESRDWEGWRVSSQEGEVVMTQATLQGCWPGSPSPTFCFCHLWLLETLGNSIYTTDFMNGPVVLCNPDPTERGSELQNEEAGTRLVSSRHSHRARAPHPSPLNIEFICGACEMKPRSPPRRLFPSRPGSQL